MSINPIVGHFNDANFDKELNRFFNTIRQSDHSVLVNVTCFDSVDFNGFRLSSQFEGLFVVKSSSEKINTLLGGGADFLFTSIDSPHQYSDWNGSNNIEDYHESTKRILDLKSKLQHNNNNVHLESEIKYARLNFAHGAVTLIRNHASLLPFSSSFTIYSPMKLKISEIVREANQIRFQKIDLTKSAVKRATKRSSNKLVFLPDTVDSEILDYLSQLKADSKTVVCFSNPTHYEHLKKSLSLVFVPFYEKFDANIFVQQLTARIDLDGDFVGDSLIKGVDINASKLARTTPEFRGLDTDTLAKIKWAVTSAINGKAFPGCQVLLAKNGCIVYDQAFGHHSYEKEEVVTNNSIYDLASLTKVVATTLVGMKLYEMGAYKLDDSLAKYLPDSLKDYLPHPSTIRDITFEELFVHQSGLPAGFPLIRYMKYKSDEVGRFDKYYCDQPDSCFNIEVAENFYLEKEYGDSMWLKLNQMWLNKDKPYKYSDVNMNTLYMMFKGIIQKSPIDFGFTEAEEQLIDKNLFVEYLYTNFYKPLGMEKTLYKPLEYFDKMTIVPTEDESWWRKQLLQGHVHDPNAALMGGIAGNAGMFSTSHDLAILCQMLLNKGVYNNQRFLQVETVHKFTSAQENSSRGLGFNKRTLSTTGYGMADSSSILTYGHTGFTGTCFWIDPQSELIYIFLSNRVHPKVNNRIYNYGIRKRIHNTAYEAKLN